MSDDLTEVVVDELPKCSFCGRPALYDFRTRNGQWAYGCQFHYSIYSMFLTLGTGKGQRLILKEREE